MAEPVPGIDFANLPLPNEGILVTLFITVRKVARSRDFYSRALGGTVVLDENPCMVKLSNSWIIMNLRRTTDSGQAGYLGRRLPARQHDLNVHEFASRRHPSLLRGVEGERGGAEFVTPPINRGAEIRCYLRDPDGYLIEVGQSTGLLHGQRDVRRPEDLPG
jgi:catechol 2,3-dioxygenase-like lactoylglutathione lyase family enzyme